MTKLESLKTVTAFRLLPDNIQHGVDQLSALSVVSLGPVVTCASLTKHKVIWSEELTEGSSSDTVHCTGLKIKEYSAGNISSTGCFVEVYINSLQLQITVAMVCSRGIDTMFIRNHLPKLCTNLVSTLASLNMNEFTHLKESES